MTKLIWTQSKMKMMMTQKMMIENINLILLISKLLFILIKAILLFVPLRAVFQDVSYWSAPKATSSFYIYTLLIFWTVPSNMSLLSTKKTICQLILSFWTLLMRMIFWTAFETETTCLSIYFVHLTRWTLL